jgi:hypothetical protein
MIRFSNRRASPARRANPRRRGTKEKSANTTTLPAGSFPVQIAAIGDALQDRFATFTRELVDRGKRVLATER